MISGHRYVLDVAGVRVDAVGGNVGVDESWSPYVQGTLTLPMDDLTAGQLEAVLSIDPRLYHRARLTCTQTFGRPWTLATITADVGASTASWTADLAGGPLSTWTGRYGRPYNTFGIRPSRRRTFDVVVRRRRADHRDGVVDLVVNSDEQLLAGVANTRAVAIAPATPTVRDAVLLVLSTLDATLADDDGLDAPLEPDSVAWEPGVHGDEYLTPLVDAGGLRLWCDEGRRWHLSTPLAAAAGALTLSTATTVDLEEDITAATGDTDSWADAVVIVYRWRDAGDVEHVRVDSEVAPGGGRQVHTVTYERPWPGNGAAAAILARVSARGRVVAARAVSDYSATPGQVLTVTLPAAELQTGLVTSVGWDLDTDEMNVRSRDLIDTPGNAWALIPPGLSWDDIPVGTSWDEWELT